MDMSVMAPFMGPGLGGIMAGTEQRQKEDQSYAATQNTLQQILASQGQEAERAALLPGKIAQEADRAAMAPLQRQETQGRIDAATAKARADTMKDYIDEQIKTGHLPGGQETINQDPRFSKLKDHPLAKRAQDIQRLRQTDPYTASQQWEILKEEISTSAATIEKRQQEQASAERARDAQAAADKRNTDNIAQRDRAANLRYQVDQAKNELMRAKALVGSPLSLDKLAAKLGNEAFEAANNGNQELANQKRAQMEEITATIMGIRTAKTYADAIQRHQRLVALGITDAQPPKREDYEGSTKPVPGAGPNAQQRPGQNGSFNVNGVTITPKAGPGPQSSAQPMGDAIAQAVLPGAQAAQPDGIQSGPSLVGQIPGTLGGAIPPTANPSPTPEAAAQAKQWWERY